MNKIKHGVFTAKVSKVHSSFCLYIPIQVAKYLKLQGGDFVNAEITIMGGD